MLLSKLTKTLDALKLARSQAKVSGHIAINELTRLKDLLASSTGELEVNLRFGQQANGLCSIEGTIVGDVAFICQRCSQPVSYAINIKLCLTPVVDDQQAKKVKGYFEPFITHGRPIASAELVEEEILLSLPMYVKHELGQCPE